MQVTPDPSTDRRQPSRSVLCLLFFVSGGLGLAYEVAWSRGLLLLLGSTAEASAMVLGVFVGGLGFGARWGGTRAERSARPLALYGVLEIAAALWALASMPLIALLEGPYVGVASALPEALRPALRLAMATVVVLPAAFLLGATLPAMVRQALFTGAEGADGSRGTARWTAWLYGANTVGAVVGCLATGFVLLEALGVMGTLFAAAAVGVVLGVVSIALGRHTDLPLREASAAPTARLPRRALLLAAAAGFLGLGIELAGFRILVFFLEGFTTTFAAMLATFIAGLGLGSLLLGPRLVQTDRPTRTLGVLLLATAACLAGILALVLPNLEAWMGGWRASFFAEARDLEGIAAGVRWASLFGAAAVLLVPAFLLGPTFALCVRIAEQAGLPAGPAVGGTYLGNSIGSLVAPFFVAFGLVPLLGVAGAFTGFALLAASLGLFLLLGGAAPAAGQGRGRRVALLAAGVVLIGGAFAARGPATTERLLRQSHIFAGHPHRSLMATETDAVTTASVVATRDGELILYTDDFAAAATGRHYRYMRMLGHLPALLAHRTENAMVIAFGTGTTAGAVAAHEGVERLEVVEVSEAVLELAPHFAEANRHVLEDRRTVVVPDDGRNALLLHEPDLDIITLEPLMPYSPQGLPFYTKEFYELARDRLREGGVVCQWIPVHAMRADLYAAFVRTFFDVFPDGELYFFEQSSALIGRRGTARPDADTLAARASRVAADLAAAGYTEPMAALEARVATGSSFAKAPLPSGPFASRLVTDLDPFPEFHPTPRANLNTTWLADTLEWLALTAGNEDAGARAALAARSAQARGQWHGVFATSPGVPAPVRAKHLEDQIGRMDTAAQLYDRAIEAMPYDRVLRARRLQVLRWRARLQAEAAIRGRDDRSEGRARIERAERALRRVLPPLAPDVDPATTDRAQTALLHAAVSMHLGRCAAALEAVQKATEALPDRAAADKALLTRVAEALAAHRRGEAFEPPPESAWMFEGIPACGPEGLARVERAWNAYRAARDDAMQSTAQLRARLRAFVQHVRDQGSEAPVLEALATLERSPRRAVVALEAATWSSLAGAFGRRDDPLRAMLASEVLEDKAAALEEISTRRLLARYPDFDPGANPPARLARPYAAGASATGRGRILCRIVPWLAHEDAAVRVATGAALFRHAQDTLADYDPRSADRAAQTAMIERLRAELDCGD